MIPVVIVILTSVYTLAVNDRGFCNNTRGICCENYVFRDGKCTECPAGTYGYNCTRTCPKGYYGSLCSGICNCYENEICNESEGCIGEPEYFKVKYDMCKAGNEQTKSDCCVNQRKAGKTCQDCWMGYYGENCEKNCTKGQERFGRFCLERCICNQEETCDLHSGCLGNQGTTHFKQVNLEKILGSVIGVALAALAAIIGINIVIRMKREPQTHGDMNQPNANGDHVFNTYKEYGISSEMGSRVPRVKLSEHPTLEGESEIDIQMEGYSTFRDFKPCSKV